jgi:hypothetical protein
VCQLHEKELPARLLSQYFNRHATGPRCLSGTVGKHLNGCGRLQTAGFIPVFQIKQILRGKIIWFRDTGVMDNSNNLAACLSTILVTADALTQLVPFNPLKTKLV